ncbi:PIGQ [Cordylochernes scorpioides]|uniref:PIGQ n=1 Tax=Cordylochernes scorpioides TaxID=51811 RepID=A0ABY6LGS6_9ARAC|nr:PIGQ [Cordylochernes scorpioides]
MGGVFPQVVAGSEGPLSGWSGERRGAAVRQLRVRDAPSARRYGPLRRGLAGRRLPGGVRAVSERPAGGPRPTRDARGTGDRQDVAAGQTGQAGATRHRHPLPRHPDRLWGRLPEDSNPFVEFLYHTCRRARAIESSVGEPAQSTCPNPDIDPTSQQSTTPRIRKIMEKSALVKEIGRKTTAVKFIANELYHTQSLSRKGRSLLCSLLGDWLLGVFALWFLTHPCLILDVGLVAIGMVVGLLKSLIWWLMGVPAGLKLNRPLNRALGHFFLYHIHLWKTYVYIILPAFSLATHTLPYAGLLGLSILLAALADLITIATLHIFCFYGYAAKLHAYETRCLAALWRLFRGKKWNPLRSRVDSYQYSANHLLLGTFLLTTLGFLLPTVLMYYVVFTLLRLGVLGLRGLLRLGAWVASICGAWAVVASSQPGALHLSILSSRPHQVPLLELSFTNGGFQMANLGIDPLVPPKWGTMFHDLFWGNLI